MDIRFDPRLPLVWRDPHTLQIGVDAPAVVLEGLTARQERLVAAIAAGHGRSGLGGLIARTGQKDAEVAQLVERLAPALADDHRVTAPVVELAGSCSLADAVERLLTDSGARVRRVDASTAGLTGDADVGIAVSRHVHDPGVSAAWLHDDLPHLAVVRGDLTTRIGPVVVPGATACAHCLDLHRADVDGAWGVIAGQLWGRVSPGLPAVAESDAAARAVRRLLRRHRRLVSGGEEAPDDPVDDAVIETVDVETGLVTTTRSRPHPDCGCAALAESGWGAAPPDLGPGPSGSTRDAADLGRG
jgi:bacteriocin biosynthesis cyclodehydratase domain-containing protein